MSVENNAIKPPAFPHEPRLLLEAARSFRAEGVKRIRAMHVSGANGRETVESLTELMDDLIRGVAAALFPKTEMPFSVVPIGGYGRSELSPGSDVDLMFLCDDPEAPQVKDGVERFLYPMWDLKLDVGYSVRDIETCLQLAREDHTVLTSLLDARLVAGESSHTERLWERIRDEILPEVAADFVREKAVEIQDRRKRFGESIYLLEPNIKESPGGLRDLHTAIWTAKAGNRARSIDDLVALGVIPPKDIGKVESALDFIWTVRNELHFHAGRKEDRLTFQGQERIALFLDYRDHGSTRAVEQFMRDYYLNADTLRHFTNRLLEEALETIEGKEEEISLGSGLVLSMGEVSAYDAKSIPENPGELIGIFQAAAERNARLSPTLLHAISQRTKGPHGGISLNKKYFGDFWELFEKRDGLSHLLEDMHEAGLLGLYLPEFETLRRQVQHDAYHIYTTDLHSIMCVRELENLRYGRLEDKLPLFTEVSRQVEDWPLMMLAALFHDIGKGVGKGHAERGSAMMPAIAERLGLSDDRADTLIFLVKNHLEMAQASQKRDLSDPGLIARFARLVEDEQRLKMLALLTVADQRAVGPEGWNEWKRALLVELYVKSLRVLEKGAESWADLRARRERSLKALADILAGRITPERIDFNMKAMPQRFFLTRNNQSVARYLAVIEKLKDTDPLISKHIDEPDEKTTEFILCTWDAPGLFFKIAGVLSFNGVNILSADIYTRSDGAVLDIFRVNDPDGGPVDETKWEKIEADLIDAFTGRINVADRVAKRKKPIINIKRRPYMPPRIEVDLESSLTCLIIEVYAHDRIGLLFDITHTLTQLGLYIDRAIIATEVDQAADVFYVKDIFGQKISEPDKIARIEKTLIEVMKESEGP